jgi:hypothetical protein
LIITSSDQLIPVSYADLLIISQYVSSLPVFSFILATLFLIAYNLPSGVFANSSYFTASISVFVPFLPFVPAFILFKRVRSILGSLIALPNFGIAFNKSSTYLPSR